METGPSLVNTRFIRCGIGLAQLMAATNKASCSKLASVGSDSNSHAQMAELTNLTDRISHLRDRKGGSPVMQAGQTPEAPKPSRKRKLPERKLATDYFMLFVYALLAIALFTQLALIAWLDMI